MKNRPLLFILLALLHIFEPAIKIFYFKYVTGFDWVSIVENIFAIDNFKAIFEFWFLFPLAGICLLGVKKWHYPVFVDAVIGPRIHSSSPILQSESESSLPSLLSTEEQARGNDVTSRLPF